MKYPAVALINVEVAEAPGTDIDNTPGPRDRAGGCHLTDLVTGSLMTSVTGFENPVDTSVGPYETDEYPWIVFICENTFVPTGSPGARNCDPSKTLMRVASFHE